MPEEKQIDMDLKEVLDQLEDKTINNYKSRLDNYEVIKQLLSQNKHIPAPVIERILMVCVHDMKEDLKYTAVSLGVILAILNKIKREEYMSLPDLLPSALAVVNIIKTIGLMRKVDILRGLCFDIFLKYPKEVLITIAANHCSEVLEIFDLYCHQRVPLDIKIQTCNIIIKFLKILPSPIKTQFVKDGLSLWFFNIIPAILTYLSTESQDNFKVLEVLELLTEELLNIDYTNNPQWKCVLESICNPTKYPLCMKSLLENGSDYWHRLWIVFIKLLNTQITRNSSAVGTPINSMLPVVELAFKMDAANRCRAFQCWNVLIDNFSTETNENCIAKRIKLLIIPLKLNNAKVEEIALAKFDSWWHLIRKFQPRLDKFVDTIIIPFLHFCFGKHSTSAKPGFVAGQISDHMKSRCVKALVEIAGHVNCEGCTDLPKLNGKLIRVKYLVDFWNDWTHALKTAIRTAANEDSELTKQQVRCLWKSFILTISELPANNIRKDLFSELLTVLTQLVQDCDNNLANIVFNDMILSLYDEEINNKQLFEMKSEEHPLYNVLSVVLHPSLNSVYDRSNEVELITKFKKITDFIVDESKHMEWLLNNLPINDNTLKLWTALAKSICESENDKCPHNLYNALMWPLKSMTQFNDTKCSAVPWHTMYNLVHSKINKAKTCDIDKEILEYLVVCDKCNNTTVYFTLCVVLAVLKRKLVSEKIVEQEPELLQDLISRVENYQSIEKIFPLLIDTLVVMLNNVTSTVNEALAKYTISCVKKVLLLTNPVLKQQSNNDVAHLLILIENLLKSMEELFKFEEYFNLKTVVVDELIECASLFSKPTKIVNKILSIMKTFLSNSKEIHTKVSAVIDVIEKENKPSCKSDDNQDIPKIDFTTPISKEIPKKVKKKEPSIVNKVVENGEEYVVVKSNWKFNPRKLTENQKEKLQRKREDIPALYQDLSQSQDEFKLVSWKTDSQDTMSTNSKSSKSANEDATVILQNLPSSNVVPTIIENIISENISKPPPDSEKKILPKDKLPTPKNTNSPRMALKDRVFRNVRNLLDKSKIQRDSENMAQEQVGNASRTPPSKAQSTLNILNSAPPLISSERPSRVKRKPKKFDDTELFSLKKSRHSQNDSPVDIEIANKVDVTLNKDGENCNDKNISATSINNNENQKIPADPNISDFGEPSIEPTNENIEIVETTLVTSLNDDKMNEKDIKEKEITKVNEDLLITGEGTNIQEKLNDNNYAVTNKNDSKEPTTPKLMSKSKEIDDQKSSVRKSSTKKSRIEKELAIDMVEGHPFLKIQSERRLTRKNLMSPANSVRRKTLQEKLNKSKSDTKNALKSERKSKNRSLVNTEVKFVAETESQEKISNSSEDQALFDDILCSEDIIESSQDSSLTTISVKSSKKTSNRLPVITLERIKDITKMDKMVPETQNLLQDLDCEIIELPSTECKDDTEISQNRTAADDKNEGDLTENMDTQPVEDNISSSADVIIVNDDVVAPIAISSEDTFIGKENQEIAEADTQPTDPEDFINLQNTGVENQSYDELNMESSTISDAQKIGLETIAESIDLTTDNNADASSPYKDDTQRQQDFLNNTLQISPIKMQSPERQNKSPSPETSSDYVVIKLSSPVHSNGEPFEKCGSPEFFTEDKISPDKRDLSPPRGEVTTNNTSPSSSLSLKKNRPQVRSGGRAAHMLGLCVPDKLHTIINSEKSEPEEVKKSSPSSTPARRNLRILYNSVADNSGNVSENEDSENFLKLKKSLPAVDSSPSGPILKRKLAEISDDITSPASKRKRVSFHDPPVSTTISVQKYIEPCGVRSPQSSAQKRQERQLRLHANMKSPKRLDTVFKLDTVLTRAVESFIDVDLTINNDTQTSSLEQTPAVEIIKTSELNDIDPICAELLDCKDPIDNIASDLSSPAMKEFFIKELEGKVETVGDLAKMTEIEINRLCIKAPKVKIAKKVLTNYASKKTVEHDAIIVAEEPRLEELVAETEVKVVSVEVEVQTSEVLTDNVEVQTIAEPLILASTQTEVLAMSHTSIQTEESGNKSTANIISSCLTERQDFIHELSEKLEESHIHHIAENLPLDSMIDLLMKKSDTSTTTLVLNRILESQSALTLSNTQNDNKELSFLRDYLCDRFESRDLILFCSQLLQKVHNKSV